MSREKWDKEWNDVISDCCDGNDFYYRWCELKQEKLEDVFYEWLGLEHLGECPIRIKVRKGSIFITRRTNEPKK